jgi:hypothetical protein
MNTQMKTAAIAALLSIAPGAHAQIQFNAPTLEFLRGIPASIAGVNLNNDGVTDLAVPVLDAANITWFFSDTTESVHRAGPAVTTNDSPNVVRGHDFDGDGIDELIVTHATLEGRIAVYGVDAGGAHTQLWTNEFPNIEVGTFEIADVDGDGIADMIASIYNEAIFEGQLWLMRGIGGFAFGAPEIINNIGASAIAINDLEGDGDLDIATCALFISEARIYTNDGEGNFSHEHTLSAGDGPFDILFEDFGNDGVPDVATVDFFGGTMTFTAGQSFGGDPFFGLPSTTVVGRGPTEIAGGDFDQDGNRDLAIVNSEDGEVAILRGIGFGFFSINSRVPTGGTGSRGIVVDDLNSDGFLDLAVINQNDSSMAIITQSNSEPCVADFTDDGVLDFFDVSAFINAFNTFDFRADLNQDFVYDFFDVSLFISAFNAGCP